MLAACSLICSRSFILPLIVITNLICSLSSLITSQHSIIVDIFCGESNVVCVIIDTLCAFGHLESCVCVCVIILSAVTIVIFSH